MSTGEGKLIGNNDIVIYMKKYWFKRKTYGWGWYPATWQGFGVLCIYLFIILGITTQYMSWIQQRPMLFLFVIISITTLLIFICYRTGEKPRWQWGKK